MTIKMKYESVYSTEENLLKKKEKTEEEEDKTNINRSIWLKRVKHHPPLPLLD